MQLQYLFFPTDFVRNICSLNAWSRPKCRKLNSCGQINRMLCWSAAQHRHLKKKKGVKNRLNHKNISACGASTDCLCHHLGLQLRSHPLEVKREDRKSGERPAAVGVRKLGPTLRWIERGLLWWERNLSSPGCSEVHGHTGLPCQTLWDNSLASKPQGHPKAGPKRFGSRRCKSYGVFISSTTELL